MAPWTHSVPKCRYRIPDCSDIVGSSDSHGANAACATPPTIADCSDTFEHRCTALPPADAHGDQRVPAPDALQLVQGLSGDDRTRCPDGVSEADAAAVGVHFRRIETQLASHRTCLGREGFVRFDHVELIRRDAGALQ